MILIGINELNTSILEYMKDVLEIKYDDKQSYINNPNNPNEPKIFKHKNFRLIYAQPLFLT